MLERAINLPETRNQRLETNYSLAYDPRFDIQAYRQLADLSDQLPLEEFKRLKNQLDLRTRHNLQACLGERFNVEISQVEYQLEGDQLISPEHDEPFLEVIRRGQQYRRVNGSPNDWLREEAEGIGFERVQKILSGSKNSDTGSETLIVISPRGPEGSTYQHNFFDIYQKTDGGKVKMSRFTSKLLLDEFWQVAHELDPNLPQPLYLSDAFFLSHPVVTQKPLVKILEAIHQEPNTLPLPAYRKLIEACTPLINAYTKNPNYRTYNALLNFAEAIVRETSPEVKSAYSSKVNHSTLKTVEQIIAFYGAQPIRQVATGCGIQVGFSFPSLITYHLSLITPFSVAEFAHAGCPECGGADDHFHCPKKSGGCGGRIESGKGITKCPHCNLTKEQAGSGCG